MRNAEAAELFMQDESPDLDEVRAILADIRKDDQRAGNVIDRMRMLLRRRDLDERPSISPNLLMKSAPWYALTLWHGTLNWNWLSRRICRECLVTLFIFSKCC